MIRRPSPVFLLAVLMLFAAWPMSGLQLSIDSEKKSNVEGTVINTSTRRPIPHALVEVAAPIQRAVLTDADGHFAFKGLPQTTLSFTVRKPGFFALSERSGSPYTMIRLGPETVKLEMKLMQEAGISGQVVDSEGEPQEHINVQVLKVEFVEGRRRLSVTSNKQTDEDGNFRVSELYPGRYYILVAPGLSPAARMEAQAKTDAEVFPPELYFPASPDFAGATPIDLVPGQRERISFVLKRKPAVKFSGVVLGSASFKIVNAPALVDESLSPMVRVRHWDKTTGSFEFPPLPAGKYTLAIYTAQQGNNSLHKQEITLDKDLTDFKFLLEPAFKIPVTVRYEQAQSRQNGCAGSFPAANGETVNCATIPAMVRLVSADSSFIQISSAPESPENPSLAVNGVMPGKYFVTVMPWSGGHLHSLRCGSADLLREPLIVSSNTQMPPIEVVLSDEGGSIKVHVRSDKTAANGFILLVPEFAPYLPPSVVDFDSTGDREWNEIEPGNYRVYAFESMEGIEYGNPEAMEKYASRATAVTINANGSTNVTVDLIEAAE